MYLYISLYINTFFQFHQQQFNFLNGVYLSQASLYHFSIDEILVFPQKIPQRIVCKILFVLKATARVLIVW